MKILIVSQYFWPENFRINEISLGLKKRGHEVEILTGKPNYPDGRIYPNYCGWKVEKEVWNNIPIIRLPIFPRGKASAWKLAINYLSFVLSGIIFIPFTLFRRKFDVVFVYAPSPITQVIPALFVKMLKGAPVVLWVQDLWPESVSATGHINSKFIINFIGKLVSFCYVHTDLILVQSKAFIKEVSKMAKREALYYPNSVDKFFYQPPEVEVPIINSLESGFCVVLAGNIGEAQDMETVILAAEILQPYKELKIVIIGSGSRLDWVKQEVKRRNLTNVFCEGRLPVEYMPHVLRKASALLITLANKPIFSFTVPNRMQAYLAVGKPIIASINGESAKLIKEACAGVAVTAGDASALASAIIEVFHMDASQRKILGENGRNFFRNNFDEEILLDDLLTHFDSVLSKQME